MADTLSNILDDMVPAEDGRIEVDASPFFKNPTVLSWKRPSVAEVYRIAKDANELMKQNPTWEYLLAVEVASIAACHVAPLPGTMPVGVFYASIANAANERCWLYLSAKFREEFGYLTTLVDAEGLKKILSESPDSASNISEGDTLLN